MHAPDSPLTSQCDDSEDTQGWPDSGRKDGQHHDHLKRGRCDVEEHGGQDEVDAARAAVDDTAEGTWGHRAWCTVSKA